MEFLQQLVPVILYFLLCILVIVLIVLVIKVIKILKNVDILLEDIQSKSRKLDGIFNVIDNVSTSVSSFGDKIVKFISTSIKKILKKKRKVEDFEDE